MSCGYPIIRRAKRRDTAARCRLSLSGRGPLRSSGGAVPRLARTPMGALGLRLSGATGALGLYPSLEASLLALRNLPRDPQLRSLHLAPRAELRPMPIQRSASLQGTAMRALATGAFSCLGFCIRWAHPSVVVRLPETTLG